MKCVFVFRLWVIYKLWDGFYNYDNLFVILKIGYIYIVLILNCRKRYKYFDYYDYGMVVLVYLIICMKLFLFMIKYIVYVV